MGTQEALAATCFPGESQGWIIGVAPMVHRIDAQHSVREVVRAVVGANGFEGTRSARSTLRQKYFSMDMMRGLIGRCIHSGA